MPRDGRPVLAPQPARTGARYYDAQVGRFVSRDTYLDQHPYLYCGHDAVNAVDPTGHSAAASALLPALLGGAVGGLVVGAWDIIDDGELNRPWWQYGVGIGVGAVAGVVVGAGALPAGVAIGGVIAVKIGLHPANHYFPRFGDKLRHIQIIRWFPPIKGSHKSWRIPLPWRWKWF